MNRAVILKNTTMSVNKVSCKLQIRENIFVLVLMIFVAVAATQAFQLSNMLSEAKSIGQDVNGIHAEREILREQHVCYGNNLSYYFSDQEIGNH